jgi:transposase-like protein
MPVILADDVASLVQRLESGEKPSDLAREFGVSRMTLHRYRTKAAES